MGALGRGKGVGGRPGLLPVRLVSSEFTEGTLVDVVPSIEVPDRPLYALYSPGGQPPARVKLFLEFVTDWFRRQPATQQSQPARQAKPA